MEIPYELKYNIALLLVLSFTGLALALFVSILILKGITTSRNIRNRRYINRMENIFNELLASYDELSTDELERYKNEVKALTGRTWQKVLLTDLLIHYNLNLTGSVESYVMSLYYDLDLNQLNAHELHQGGIRKKVRAMRALSEMRDKNAWIEIIKYINDDRKLLRVEASLALIFLTKNPLFFLDKLEKRMTKWQMLNVYKRLLELPREKIPVFERWFRSANESVSLFALEMAAKFNQTDSIVEVSKLLENQKTSIRVQALKTLVQLEAYGYVDYFVSLLRESSDRELTLQLLKSIGNISLDRDHLKVLEEYLTNEDFEIRFAASKALLKIEGGKEHLKNYVTSYPEKLLSIQHHLNNPLLT